MRFTVDLEIGVFFEVDRKNQGYGLLVVLSGGNRPNPDFGIVLD